MDFSNIFIVLLFISLCFIELFSLLSIIIFVFFFLASYQFHYATFFLFMLTKNPLFVKLNLFPNKQLKTSGLIKRPMVLSCFKRSFRKKSFNIILFPLHRRWWLRGNIINNTIGTLDFVNDSCGDFL
ncbi:hypothetical protein SAMN05446037_102325 [Anaerovirgula multivorans]|uniref:Uncharacterized protein n=1 Tax=Anaerovirgula multivorans TaxID=312168 RepID=A0A239HR82_9FIRM|nr:hypothetical protein SAMN05446037_102325 [Anaerovirgula multivorans]